MINETQLQPSVWIEKDNSLLLLYSIHKDEIRYSVISYLLRPSISDERRIHSLLRPYRTKEKMNMPLLRWSRRIYFLYLFISLSVFLSLSWRKYKYCTYHASAYHYLFKRIGYRHVLFSLFCIIIDCLELFYITVFVSHSNFSIPIY